jgi:hypothetical protein
MHREDSPPVLEAHYEKAATAGGDPVMGDRQLSGSLADLWPETAIALLALQHGLENSHHRAVHLAQANYLCILLTLVSTTACVLMSKGARITQDMQSKKQ